MNEVLIGLVVQSIVVWGLLLWIQRESTKDMKEMKNVWDELRMEIIK